MLLARSAGQGLDKQPMACSACQPMTSYLNIFDLGLFLMLLFQMLINRGKVIHSLQIPGHHLLTEPPMKLLHEPYLGMILPCG